MDIVVPQIDDISEDYKIEWDNDFDICQTPTNKFVGLQDT